MSATRRRRKPRFGTMEDMAVRLGSKLQAIADTSRSIDPDAANTLELKMISALGALISGQGDVDHMTTLTTELSLCARACELDFAGSGEHIGIALAARDALEQAGLRHLRTKRWGLAGLDIARIRNVIELRSAIYNHPGNTVGLERRLQSDVAAAIRQGNYVRFIVEAEPRREAVAA